MNTYSSAIHYHPLLTHVVTGGVLAVIGDALAQKQEKAATYNEKRAVSFCAFDMSYRALQHYAFPWIVSNFRGEYCMEFLSDFGLQEDDPTVCSAIEGTLVNQLVIVPIIYYPIFFLLTAMVQGMTINDGCERAKSKFTPLMQRHLIFWLPIQYLQFRYIEEDLQIPFVCLVGLGWTVILSLVAGNVQNPIVGTKKKRKQRLAQHDASEQDNCKVV